MKILKQILSFVALVIVVFAMFGAGFGIISLFCKAGYVILALCNIVPFALAIKPAVEICKKLIGVMQGGHKEKSI